MAALVAALAAVVVALNCLPLIHHPARVIQLKSVSMDLYGVPMELVSLTPSKQALMSVSTTGSIAVKPLMQET